MSANVDKLKEKLTNELGDKLRSIEMDVTSSFLNGKICSPLLATANTAALQAQSIARGTLNAAAQAGLYITKDGLKYDPTVMVNMAGQIVNSALQSATSELVRLKDNAIREITYIPDPSIIVKKAASYFAYNIKNDIELNNLLDEVNSNMDDKQEERQTKVVSNTHKKINEFITYKLPQITDKINTISNNINNVISTTTSYMAFGPEWVSEKIAYYIADGSYIAETFLNNETDKLNDWKLEQYNKAAKSISDMLTKKYTELMKQNLKVVNDEIEVQKKKASLKVISALQKTNLEIMAKTGIKIPIQKVTPENLSKIKRAAEIGKMVSMAAQAAPQDGPETSNNNEITNAEQAPKQEKYPKELLEKRSNQLYYKLGMGLSHEVNAIFDKIAAIESAEGYNIYNKEANDQIKFLEDEKLRLAGISIKAKRIGLDILEYIKSGDEVFYWWKKSNRDLIRAGFEPDHEESFDKLMETAMKLLRENSYMPSPKKSPNKMMVWDDEADDYIEVTSATGSKSAEVTGSQATIPEMYAQNFMNAGGNGPVNV